LLPKRAFNFWSGAFQITWLVGNNLYKAQCRPKIKQLSNLPGREIEDCLFKVRTHLSPANRKRLAIHSYDIGDLKFFGHLLWVLPGNESLANLFRAGLGFVRRKSRSPFLGAFWFLANRDLEHLKFLEIILMRGKIFARLFRRHDYLLRDLLVLRLRQHLEASQGERFLVVGSLV